MRSVFRGSVVILCVVLTSAIAEAQGGTIEATVTHRTTGEPIQSFSYTIFDVDSDQSRYSGGASAGGFSIFDVEPGTYSAAVVGPAIVGQITGEVACLPVDLESCPNIADGASFTVRAGETTQLTFAVDRKGVIQGRINGEADGFIDIDAFSTTDLSRAPLRAFAFGNEAYTLEGLDPGSYVLLASGEEIVDQLYDGVPCIQEINLEGCDNLSQGTVLEIALNQVIEGIDFEVQLGGSISGQIVDSTTGQPIERRTTVRVWDSMGRERARDTFNFGEYKVTGLNTATYTVTAGEEFVFGFNEQLYRNMDCPGAGTDPERCDVTTGTPVNVQAGDETPGINFELRPKAAITGRVTDSADGSPLDGAFVRIFDTSGRRVSDGRSDESGMYRAGGLDAGTYYALTDPSLGSQFISEIYDDIPCPPYAGPCEPQRVGLPIAVATDEIVEGIDFALDKGGTITGRIRDAATGGAPMTTGLLELQVWTLSGVEAATGRIDPEGNFVAPDPFGLDPGLASGHYYVTVHDSGIYLGEIWGGDSYCRIPPCDLSGTPIAVAEGQITSGINFDLDVGGSISGRVQHAASGQPIRVSLDVWDSSQIVAAGSTLTQDGTYRIDRLLPGDYYVSTRDSTYQSQVYPGAPCSGRQCDSPEGGELVPVSLSQVTEGIDFSLPRFGSIRGRVTAKETGEQVDAFVQARTLDGQGGIASQQLDGSYLIEALLPGTYYVTVNGAEYGWVQELYDDHLCPTGTTRCDLTRGDPLVVDLESDIEGIDFVLERGGTVSGRVVDAATGEPLASNTLAPRVSLYTPQGDLIAGASASSDGSFQIGTGARTLSPGAYYAFGDGLDYVHQLFSGIDCPRFELESCDLSAGSLVEVVNATDQPGIDFALTLGGSIAGSVRVVGTGEPVGQALVVARDATGAPVDAVSTNPDGNYQLRGVPEGTYYVTAEHPDFIDVLHPDLPCEGADCEIIQGSIVTVTSGNATPAIDFELGTSCTADFGLCLQSDAFEVRATWTNFEGNSGPGHARSLTDGTGLFWFFNPDNLELMVKVLDACDTEFESFWVFAAGLTNVGVDLEVTHLATGTTWRSNSPLGTAFAPILDTEGLSVCDSAVSRSGREHRKAHDPRHDSTTDENKTSLCNPTGSNLCLADGRFRVEAFWRTPEGNSGDARTLPLTDETGTFWFFNIENVEVIVKVLDACRDFDSFWVFAAGLTDLQVTIKVTDTLTGKSREYFNPLGTAFVPIQDTETFQDCPEG